MPHLWFEKAMLPGGWADRVRFEIAHGRILACEIGVDPQAGDVRGGIAVPGMPNVHSHAFQRGMAGLAEVRGPTDDDFWTWRQLMYRFLDRLGPDDVLAIAAFAYVEMLEAGYTRVGEFHYLHHDPDGRPYADPAELAGCIAVAAQATGIGLTLLPVFYAHGDFGGAAPVDGQRRFISDLDGFAGLLAACRRHVAALPDAIVGVAPHSLRAVTPDELHQLVALAGDGPIHIHAAEQQAEVDRCIAWSGARPVAWLLDNAPVDRRWCLIHATHVDVSETAALAASGAVAGLCPTTEANLGDGIFPAVDFRAAGGAFGIGSDSNVVLDPARELELLEYGQRLSRRARNLLADAQPGSTGGTLFRAALAGGSQSLGIQVPGLAVGASADIVTLDPDHPALVGRAGEAILDSWVFAPRAGIVRDVWRAGVKLVWDGRHLARDGIVARYKGVLARLLAS